MTRYIEEFLPPIRDEGINTLENATIGGTLSVTGALASGAQTVTGSNTVTGSVIARSGTAVPATAGAVAAGIPVQLFSNGPSIYVTSDVPTHTAVTGSLCINTAGISASTRLYVNSGTTNWVAITTAS